MTTIRSQKDATHGWPSAIYASHHTLSGARIREPSRFTLEERRIAAELAGFDGIGLRIGDYRRQCQRFDFHSVGGIDTPGAPVVEVEMLFGWDDPSPSVRDQSRDDERVAYEIADRFGSRLLNVGVSRPLGVEPDVKVLAERFAELCDRAADHDLIVALEFMPWSALSDLHTTTRVVESAAQPNGGILLDSWHFFRGTSETEHITEAAPHIVSVQLDDAPFPPLTDTFIDSTERRALPGEGSLPLTSWIELLRSSNVDSTLSVEIISTEHRKRELKDAALLAFASSRKVLEARAAGV